jgi:hypothetical protein
MARSPHKPSPESRAQVEALSGYGVRQDEIAIYLNIDPKTLRKHYEKEIDTGHIKANVGVARSLHKNATEGNVTAQIFWLKARAGWRDKPEAGIDDDPLLPTAITVERNNARLPE